MQISYSIFDLYSRCPLQYKFSYIERRPRPKRPELDFGSLMHRTVESALRKEPVIPSLKELLTEYDANFKEAYFENARQKQQYYLVGQEMLKAFYNDLKPGLRDTIAIEKRFYLKLNDKHALKGVIDRVDRLPFGAYEVIDYKTNFKPKTQQEIDKDKQLGTYHLAMRELWPDAQDVRLSMYFLKPNLKLTTTRENHELDTLRNEIIAVADKIENETEFAPKQNPLCDWCDFQHLCPLKKDKFAPTSEVDIKSVVDEYCSLEAQKIALEQKIHAHFDAANIESLEHPRGTIHRDKKRHISIN